MRTSTVFANKYRRAIYRFDEANNVTIYAVFLGKPRKRTFS